jgi:BolA family transcriptional regulator, general stress-responsive regulator
MDGYDACSGYASSLDIRQTAIPRSIYFQKPSRFLHSLAARPMPAALSLTRRPAQRKTPRMLVKDDITRKLQDAFAPDSVEVIDESDQHHGHAGHRPGGQTHFRVYIVSKAFAGKSRLERHRMINQVLAANLAGGVHALAIHADAPGEHTR